MGPPPDELHDLRDRVGHTDVYLLDQILKGRFGENGCVLLDAGCGGGRNLVHFLRAGYAVSAVDRDSGAVEAAKDLARRLAPDLALDGFRVAPLEDLPFADETFGAVLASAVLHFARDEEHFDAMLGELWRVLAPRGFLFTRLASTVGIEDRVRRIEGRSFHLPDGSDRFLVDEEMLLDRTRALGARLAEPLKTVLVHGQRSMTNWFLRKP
jgi:tellurite methyltransferase